MPITGNGNNNILVGTSGDDDIYGLGGDDVLIGGGGNDLLDGGTGNDTMDGGAGNDVYVVDSYNDQVVEYANKGTDTIKASITYSLNYAQNVENLTLTGSADIDAYGNAGDNILLGNSGDNELWGLEGNDILKGGGGDDVLLGGAGVDTMVGGNGNDTYYVDEMTDKVNEGADGGNDTVYSSVQYSLGANVENLVLTGNGIPGAYQSAYGNDLDNKITGNSGNNVLLGGLGADIMKGGKGDDIYYVDQAGDKVTELASEGYDGVYSEITYTLGANLEMLGLIGSNDIDGFGNGQNNHLYGNSGSNELWGFEGMDFLDGMGGNDILHGGKGDDWYMISDAGDDVVELFGEGIDSVKVTGDFGYTLTANVEKLTLGGHGMGIGNDLDNIILGNEYDNIIDGGAGQDLMQGSLGDDTYYVDNTLDYVSEYATEGNDTVFATANYTLAQHLETLSLATGNAIKGTGNDQSNTIYGNNQDNELDGGGGSDTLSGLGGNDTFVFKAGQANGDTVYEFNGNGAGAGDMLKFVGYGPGATLQQYSATEWIVSSANGSIQEVITLIGAPTLDASDYMFA
jgi:trimeric autotransporter adhesin